MKRRSIRHGSAAGVLMAALALSGAGASPALAQDDDFFRLDPIRPPAMGAMDQPGFRPHAPGSFGGGSRPGHPGHGPRIPGLLEFREILPRAGDGRALFEIVLRPLATGPAELSLLGPEDFVLEDGGRSRFATMAPGDPTRFERAFADLSRGEPKALAVRLTVFDKTGQPALVVERALAFNQPEPGPSERLVPAFFAQPDGTEIVQYMRPEQAELYRNAPDVRIGEPMALKPLPEPVPEGVPFSANAPASEGASSANAPLAEAPASSQPEPAPEAAPEAAPEPVLP